jgi:Holliday junction resolvase YEN1
MGIHGLWEVIGRGDLVSLAQYATDHYKQHGRPLRVAVDEPGWRFNNLTPAQVAFIRSKEPAANPIEKNIMWRILHLMKYNIQLVWVFDGPRRPWKRNKRGGGGSPRDERERTQLTRQLLDHLKVPHHNAPAEAEAECVRMQRLGIVDAVWSDDGDTLMFGATCILSAHKEGKSWSQDKIRVVQAEKILAEHDLDRESLVAWAVLAGGDYDTTGLPSCGAQIARLVSRKRHGLGRALCQASEYDLPAWRSRLEEVLRQEGKQLLVPPTFPDFKALGHYCNPVVTPEDELRNINYLKSDWDPKIDQAKLRVLLRHRFNIWTKGFMKHIAPVFMIRQLARCPSHDEALSENLKYDIQLKRTKQKKAGPGEDVAQPTQLEKKIAFYPLPAVDIDITEPLGSGSEDWSIWEKNGSHYDPAEHVECNVLSCFLEHGLPEGFLVAPEPPKRQRKQNSGAVVTDPGEIGVAPTPPQETDSVNTVAVESATKKRGRPKKTSTSASADAAIVDAAPKKRGRPPKDGNTASAKPQPKKRKALAGAESPAKSSPPVFRLPREFSFASSADSTQNHEEPTISAPRLTESTHPAINPPSQLSSFPTTPQAPSNPVPGETTSPATLRALRASRWGLPGPNASTTAATAADTPYAVAPKVPPGVLVIDLTD